MATPRPRRRHKRRWRPDRSRRASRPAAASLLSPAAACWRSGIEPETSIRKTRLLAGRSSAVISLPLSRSAPAGASGPKGTRPRPCARRTVRSAAVGRNRSENSSPALRFAPRPPAGAFPDAETRARWHRKPYRRRSRRSIAAAARPPRRESRPSRRRLRRWCPLGVEDLDQNLRARAVLFLRRHRRFRALCRGERVRRSWRALPVGRATPSLPRRPPPMPPPIVLLWPPPASSSRSPKGAASPAAVWSFPLPAV